MEKALTRAKKERIWASRDRERMIAKSTRRTKRKLSKKTRATLSEMTEPPTRIPGGEEQTEVGRPTEAGHVQQWLQDRGRQLPFGLGRRSVKMPIGARAVAVKGEDCDDWGRMAVVSRHAGSQVETEFRGPTGAWRKKRKAPASLIRLEEGLELITDEDLCPVIRRMPEEQGDDRGGGVASSNEETELAQ
jgi:hypothetical protein